MVCQPCADAAVAEDVRTRKPLGCITLRITFQADQAPFTGLLACRTDLQSMWQFYYNQRVDRTQNMGISLDTMPHLRKPVQDDKLDTPLWVVLLHRAGCERAWQQDICHWCTDMQG